MSEPWHLDKRVPIALILSLAAQTAGMVWWAASLNRTVHEHERRLAQIEHADVAAVMEQRRVAEGLVRLEERLSAQTQILRRIEDGVQRAGRPAAPYP
jgi:hypothetical protein